MCCSWPRCPPSGPTRWVVLVWGVDDLLLPAAYRGEGRGSMLTRACALPGEAAARHVQSTSPFASPPPRQDAIDRAVTAAVGGDPKAIAGWNITRLVPFNPVDKKTLAEVGTGVPCRSQGLRRRSLLVFWHAHGACGSVVPHPCTPAPSCPTTGHIPHWPAHRHLQGRTPDCEGPAGGPRGPRGGGQVGPRALALLY